jgi:hypothetical protein
MPTLPFCILLLDTDKTDKIYAIYTLFSINATRKILDTF